jgi:hypothetical protein
MMGGEDSLVNPPTELDPLCDDLCCGTIAPVKPTKGGSNGYYRGSTRLTST